MSFDSSRFTSDPWQNFSGVVMQQGRVQLDSDWNEWLAEYSRRIQATTLDVIGQAGVPSSTPNGFEITPITVAGKVSVSIGQGRMYIDGVLAENHGLPAPNPEKWTPAPDAVPESTYPNWDGSLDELVGPNPVDYNSQPYYPNAPAFPQTGGPYLIYLDAWQREVTFLEDPDLIEKAVGVDTTGRLQTVWQTKFLDVSGVTGVSCTTDVPAFDALLLPPGPRLTTGVVQSSPSGPCCLTPNTGYTGLENQLYRLEIHQPGAAGTATFKWSRDNASVATGVTAITQGGTVLTVQSTGRDSVLRFSPNDWVEITDDWLELNGLPGELHQVTFVSDSAKTVTFGTAVSAADFPVDGSGNTTPSRHTRLVRWDQGGQILESDGVTVYADLTLPGSTGDIKVPPPGTTLILESGITVTFTTVSPGTAFVPGQYWTFAARTADGTVEYLDSAPPRGIYHHYARLALMTPPSTVTSCRTVFPPLTGLQEGGCCCCSVTVGDGISSKGDFTDIQQAIDSMVKVTTIVEVCLLAGTYTPAATINITRNNLTLRGCEQATIKSPGAGPVFSIVSASGITLDALNVQASSTVVEVTLGAQISITNCDFTLANAPVPAFAVIAQSSAVTVSENLFTGGGIWILDGSSELEINDNVITGAQGPGIALGGLPTGTAPAPTATGVLLTEIVHNQITGATNSGISTVFEAEGGSLKGLGDIEDLLIERNEILNCALSAPQTPYSADAVAGIVIENAVDVVIIQNAIANNGTANDIPTCGVYFDNVSNLEISNNRIIDNGVGPRTQAGGLQVGISGRITRYKPTDSLRIKGNEIRMPAGLALYIDGAGPMTFTGNILQSFGVWPPSRTFGLVIWIVNYGLPLELGKVAMGALERANAQLTTGGVAAASDYALMDGRTLFDGNQVTFVPDPAPRGLNFPCVFLSYDDLALQNNQFEATMASFMFAHTLAFGVFSLRTIGNRFSEYPGTAFLSHLGIGLYNIVNLNQATHCVQAMGTNTMPGTNQVIVTALCQYTGELLKELLGGL